MSFEFGMRPRGPQGFVTAPTEPEDYDVDEEADPPLAAAYVSGTWSVRRRHPKNSLLIAITAQARKSW